MALRREWTDSAFPVLDLRGFYSTSGACSVIASHPAIMPPWGWRGRGRSGLDADWRIRPPSPGRRGHPSQEVKVVVAQMDPPDEG
jgi:hypothetical protein